MAIEICPLSVDFGNLADWAAVVVAGLAAFAVFRLSAAANRTAEAAFANDARQQAREEALYRRERALLARDLLSEVNGVWAEVQKLDRTLQHADRREYWGGAGGMGVAIANLALTACSANRDRLHLLPDAVAIDVAEALRRVPELVGHGQYFTDFVLGQEGDDAYLGVVAGTCRLLHQALEKSFVGLRDVVAETRPVG